MMNKVVENITCFDQSILVINNDYTPYYSPDNTRPMDGVLRTCNGGLEYYDAHVGDWLPLPGCKVELELGHHTAEVVKWAQQKMLEEDKLDELAEKYPALKKAKENYDIIRRIVQNEVAEKENH